MLGLVASALSVFLAAALLVAGQMLLSSNLSLRMAAEGFSAGMISLVMIHNSFGFMLGSVYGPRLIRRVGHIRAFSAFAAVMCCATLGQGAEVSPLLWAPLRAAQGFSSALMLVVLESWINAHARPETRSRFLSFYMVNTYVAGASGQWMVGLNEPTDFRAFSLAAGLLVAALVPLCLTRQPAPATHEAGRMSFRELYRASRISVFGAAMSGFTLAAFYQLSPIYVQHLFNDTDTTAAYMGCAVLGMMLFQIPIGRLSDRIDRRRVIFGLAVAIAVSAALVAVLGRLSMTWLFLITMLFTGTAACLYPACLARLNDRTGGRQHVEANASLLLCNGLGQCVGPLGVSLLIALIGFSGLYIGIALMMLAYAVYTAWRVREFDTAVMDQQASVAVPAVNTPTIAELDPRAPSPDGRSSPT
ncbi:MAG: major facilitator superfamily 1 [Panacagrimonas sp.]|nr:MFS transporter [Panacagrimonas sp.]MCC2656076.1 major facilitator superfamily 1 [Panacagrimonas sp.]